MFDFGDLLSAILPVVFTGIPLLVALLLGILLPLALLAISRLTRSLTPSTRLSVIMVTMVVGSALSVALSGRVLLPENGPVNPLAELAEPSRWGVLASQITNIALLLLASAEIVTWITSPVSMRRPAFRLWAAMACYFFLSIVISGLFGVFRNPRLNDLYVPIVLTGMALLAEGSDVPMWRRMRWALLVPAVGSLIAMVAMPKLALLPDYAGLIPGFDKRLYGLSDHANSLGIFAAVGLALEFATFVRARPSWLVAACQCLVLLLTQSKTAWAGAAVAIVVLRWFWIRGALFKGDKQQMAMVSAITACLVIAVAVTGIAAAADSPRVARVLDRIGAFSFTGRTAIWQVTFEEFMASPITGYGPSLWDLPYRFQKGMLQAGQAHNQFIQTLGQAGLLGFLSLIAYLGLMTRYAARQIEHDKGWSLVLLFMLMVRCFSESPMRMSTLLGADWIHFATFAAAAAYAGSPKSVAALGKPGRMALLRGSR